MVLQPTFVPFTPWTTLESYRDLLTVIAEQGLVENVAPIQLGIRLLIPAGSRLLELGEIRAIMGEFDPAGLLYPWKPLTPAWIPSLPGQEIAVRGRLNAAALNLRQHMDRRSTAAGISPNAAWRLPTFMRARFRVWEPWYCCAEPTGTSLSRLSAGGHC
jgi:hypothetical protein